MDTSNKSILILDRDEVLCDELAAILGDAGYQAYSKREGPEGFRLLEERDFDLVLLGLDLPAAEERNFLRRIRENKLQTKVIVLAGIHSSHAQGAGEITVLSKPLNVQTLLKNVSELIGPGTRSVGSEQHSSQTDPVSPKRRTITQSIIEKE